MLDQEIHRVYIYMCVCIYIYIYIYIYKYGGRQLSFVKFTLNIKWKKNDDDESNVKIKTKLIFK